MFFLLFSQQLRQRASDVPSFGKFFRWLEILLLDLFLMGLIYGLAEHASWFDSLWLVWQTSTTVGYGDMPPKTVVGMSGVMLTGTIGILLLSYVVGAGVEYLGDRKIRRLTGLEPNPQKGSYLLICCRDKDQLGTFISELRCVSPKASVCIVDDIMDELPGSIQRLPDVYFVKGSILSTSTYQQAGVAACKQVIVFPHQPDLAASDGTTENIVTLVERLAPKNVPILHFLVSVENEDLFQGSRSKSIYKDFDIYAAIQECQDPGSAEIFSTLMSNSHGANPTTFYPEKLTGWTWGQFLLSAIQFSQNTNIPVNPLALIQDGKSNPCPDLKSTLNSGDSVSLIVQRGFSYPDFEAQMVKLKPS